MKGIFLYRSSMGYTVHIDDHTMDLDVSWSEANKLATDIAALRNKSGRFDGRGYARCRHEGNKACWNAMEHLPTFEVEPKRAPVTYRDGCPECGEHHVGIDPCYGGFGDPSETPSEQEILGDVGDR